jgi:hypothetical protein
MGGDDELEDLFRRVDKSGNGGLDVADATAHTVPSHALPLHSVPIAHCLCPHYDGAALRPPSPTAFGAQSLSARHRVHCRWPSSRRCSSV